MRRPCRSRIEPSGSRGSGEASVGVEVKRTVPGAAEGGLGRFLLGVGPRTMWISIGGCVFFGAYETAKSLLSSLFPS